MKNKALMGLIATATIGTAIVTPAMINSPNTTKIVNKVLMVNNSSTNEAVVINGNSSMNLYALSNGSGIVSKLSTGEMLTILGQAQKGYCKVKVQETGAVGYISVANMQNILNGTNDLFIQLSGTGQVVNVSSNVRIRSNPAIGNNIIGYLTNGTNLNILGKQGQWYKVSVNGQIGFIYEEYVSISHANVNNQSTTNNININSGKTNTSSTNLNNSNSISNTNSSNQVKNTIVKTKSLATSNSSSNTSNNTQHAQDKGAHVNNMRNESKVSINKNSNISQVNSGIINNTSSLISQDVYPIPGKISNVYKSPNTKSSIIKNIENTNIKMKVLGIISNTNGYNAGDKVWYKVEIGSGIIGYVPQSFTYYKIIYTNPNANIPICLGPNEADQDSTVIKHEKIPMYVSYALSNVKNRGSVVAATFYKVTLKNGISGFVTM